MNGKKVNDPKVIGGYNFIEQIYKRWKSLKLVKSINNRYATHYVDKDLEPNTKYAYQISAKLSDGTESVTTDAYIVKPFLELFLLVLHKLFQTYQIE